VIKALPPDLPVIIRTTASERIFREELNGRAFHYAPAEFDCGCIQPDSVTILKRETLERYRRISEHNAAILDDETRFLAENSVDLVVSDIAPFPLAAAKKAGIKAVAATNFTWWDIYRPYCETPADFALLSEIAFEYAQADLALISDLHCQTTESVFPIVEHVPITARIGESVRSELDHALSDDFGLPSALDAPNLGILYLGTWGLDIDWDAVEALSDWRFVSYDPLARPVRNVARISRNPWVFANTVASADAMISKVGYGSTTDCIAHNVPNIHLPRRDFAEYEALKAGMDLWGGRIELSEEEFMAGAWRKALSQVPEAKSRINPNAFSKNGAQVIANRLLNLLDLPGHPGAIWT
jgi:hypothetical protein